MSCETVERIRLAKLVSEHVKRDPDLNTNELFWKLVKQCADTIAFATDAGREMDFVTSHSGFGSHTNAVFLMIEDVPFGIRVSDSDDGRFWVIKRGISDSSIRTSAALLARVKLSIG